MTPPGTRPDAAAPLSRLRLGLARPVDGSSLAAFRIVFGIVMLLEAFTFFHPSFSSGGMSHLDVYYAGPSVRFHMPYLLDACIAPLPRGVFVAAGWLLGLGAAAMVLGLWHRVSSLVVFLSWAFLYGIESTRTYWMSYYWLELLVAFALVWMPASNRFSLDSLRSRRPPSQATVPTWTVALLRAQLVVTYFYAGVAKLNPDWLLDFMPVRWFLAQPHVAERLRSFLGETLAATASPWLLGTPGAAFFSWAGALFDVSVGFLLLHRRSRLLALGLTWTFHGANHFLLFRDIEWFPLLGAASATIFLEPDWPARIRCWLRSPRWAPPDWRWAVPGLLLLPGIGILLGWKSRQAPAPAPVVPPAAMPPWKATLVASWVALHALIPIRHLFIPGDPRITFEGLSFSWRLKAEYYQTHPAEITVADPAVLESKAGTRTRVHWDQWQGPPILHRAVERGRIDWRVLPALCVVSDPSLGDRILFNPMAYGVTARDEDEARERVAHAWKALHGRQPDAIHRAMSMGAIVDSYIRAAAQKGTRLRTRDEAMAMIQREHGRMGNGSMTPFLRRSHPFPTGYDDASPNPFLWIEDARLLVGQHPALPRIQPNLWKITPALLGTMDERRIDEGGTPVVLMVERPRHAPLPMPAPFTLWDDAAEPERPPEIRWDGLADAGQSKYMHVSLNPFLLRRYARRVADAWEASTHRRPAVHARTFVGLNTRPPQPVVDPAIDLVHANVPWLAHAPWVLDLQSPHIPRPMAWTTQRVER